VALGDLAQASLGALEALRRDAERATRVQPVAEELAFPDQGDSALLLVDLEPRAAFEEARHRGHDPFPRRLRTYIDVAVVGITTEPVVAVFEFLVPNRPAADWRAKAT